MKHSYNDPAFSIRKRIRSFQYGFSGIWLAIRSQHNLWIHIGISILVIAAGIVVHLSRFEWLIVGVCIGLVITTELLNTAIEFLADALHPDKSEKIMKVKDVAAGAVLFSAIAAAIIGLVIFIPKFAWF